MDSEQSDRFVWVCTHSVSQRWGNRSSNGSYKTDWNACSLVDSADATGTIQEAIADLSQHCSDLVLGLAVVKPGFVYDALCNLSYAEQRQQAFWSSVFGNSLHARLYFFAVHSGQAWALPNPMPLPVMDKKRMKTFFGFLDVGAGKDLAKQLDGILPNELMGKASQTTFCVRLPAYFAWSVARAKAESFALPDPDVKDLFHNSVRKRSRMVGWSHWPASMDEFEPPQFLQQSENFSSCVAEQIAKLIRGLASGISREGNEETLQQCHVAVSTLMQARDEMSVRSLHEGVLQLRGRVNSNTLPFQAAFLIKSLLVCNHLRDSSDLKSVLRKAIDMVMPKTLAREYIQEFFESKELRIPNAPKLARTRLVLDAALMLFNRGRHRNVQGKENVRYAMVDSSVQGHYNLELLRVVSIGSDVILDVFATAWECIQATEDIVVEQLGDPELPEEIWLQYLEDERARWEYLSSNMTLDLFPAVALGNQQLFHKFHAVAHALYLETGDPHALQSFSSEIVAFCTDQGTEFALPKIPAIPVHSLFSFLRPAEDEMSWAPEFGEGGQSPGVDFSKATPVAGLLHIIHNSSSDLGKSMSCWDSVIQQLQHVSRLLRKRDSKTRLLESCFNDHVGRNFHSDLKAFQCKLHTGRWGSVSACILKLLELEAVLRYGWDARKFKGNQNPQGVAVEVGSESNQFGVDVAVVDAAIKSPLFWGRLRMLESLAIVLQESLAWAEGCPCHSPLEHDHDLRRLYRGKIPKQWAKCPMRGLRAPELAAGDFFRVFDELVDKTSAELLVTLPRDLGFDDRMNLLHDFESGKNHLRFVVRLRLAHWNNFPWKIYGCAHASKAVRRKFLEMCLNATPDEVASCHLLQDFLSDSVREEANQFLLQDDDVRNYPGLSFFIAKLFFCPTAEREVEGDHAIVHRKVALARNHTIAYVSLARRMSTIQRLIDSEPSNLTKLAALMQRAHSPALVLSQLGLNHHPSAALIASYRDAMHAKIVYHADPATMFRCAPDWSDLIPPANPDTGAIQDLFLCWVGVLFPIQYSLQTVCDDLFVECCLLSKTNLNNLNLCRTMSLAMVMRLVMVMLVTEVNRKMR